MLAAVAARPAVAARSAAATPAGAASLAAATKATGAEAKQLQQQQRATNESLILAAMSAQQSNWCHAMPCLQMDAAEPDVAEHSINERLVQLLNLLQQLGALCMPHGNQHAGQGIITDHDIQLPPLLAVQSRYQASLSLRSSWQAAVMDVALHRLLCDSAAEQPV